MPVGVEAVEEHIQHLVRPTDSVKSVVRSFLQWIGGGFRGVSRRQIEDDAAVLPHFDLFVSPFLGRTDDDVKEAIRRYSSLE